MLPPELEVGHAATRVHHHSRRCGGSVATWGAAAAAGETMKKRRSTTTGPKRRNAPKAVRRRKPSAADANEKIALLEHRLNEALEQQTATSEVVYTENSNPNVVVMKSAKDHV